MRKSRLSEEQIIGILKQAEAGMAVAVLCRQHGMSDATFYKWRSKVARWFLGGIFNGGRVHGFR